jgi:hypothetical protein
VSLRSAQNGCKFGIEDAIPDPPEFSRARDERFREGHVFRRVVERVSSMNIFGQRLHPVQ